MSIKPVSARSIYWAGIPGDASAKMNTNLAVRNLRVMLVDDNIPFLDGLARQLRSAGYRNIRTYSDPRVALADQDQFKPDIVFTDLAMPEMTGDKLIERIVASRPEKTPRFVMCSGLPPTDALLTSLRAGEISFVPKGSAEMLGLMRTVSLESVLGRAAQSRIIVDEPIVEREKYLSSPYFVFLGRLVHKFNNVLTVAIANNEFIDAGLKTSDAGQLAEDVQTVQTAFGQIQTMIESVYEFGQISSFDEKVLEAPIFGLMDEDETAKGLVAFSSVRQFQGLQLMVSHYGAGLLEINKRIEQLQRSFIAAGDNAVAIQGVNQIAKRLFRDFQDLNKAVLLTETGQNHHLVVDWVNYYELVIAQYA